jgi:prolyl oligopeptidase
MVMNSKNEELQNYLKDYWEHRLKHNPTFATYIGDHRYDDALEDLSEESITEQVVYYRALLSKTAEIDAKHLTPENKLNYSIFQNTLHDHIRMYEYKTHYIPMDQMSGPHIDFPQLIEFHPFTTRKDFENYIARLNAFPHLIEQVIENLQKGTEQKITAFKKNMELAAAQVETFTTFSTEDNPLFSPVLKMQEEFSARDKEELTASIKEAISSCVTPAYMKLYQYLSNEYIKHCREQEGIWALPDGIDMYRFFSRYHTTTDLSPEEIHEIGKSEVERIGSDIKRLIHKIGFSGSIREFADYVKEKKELYPKSGQEILDGYRAILTRMDKRLPDFFGRLPKARYDLKEIEKYREQSAPAAYYYPPPGDFSRPGYFYANTYKPEQRPGFIMEALSYHEAVPGHHLQIAIMQELKDLPDFRKYEGSTAFIEGWALYAEKLAGEMGFYQDDFSEYGRLNFEIWRAVRLVVDTGLHYYKWSRQEAIKYCRENSGEEDHEIEVEVDRYIAMPGQALAYKIGELEILKLREKAMKVLGSGFDVKEFHDRLLENGALPLYAMEDVMNQWMKPIKTPS